MGPRTISLTADLKPSAIDPDQRQRRPCFHLWLEPMSLEVYHLLIAISLQLLTNLMGDPAGLSTADVHLGEFLQGVSRFLKRRLAGTGAKDLAKN
jgi:hypothetical protein